ncbi:MAG: 30S ribosomal protein S9 [Candidatus Hydrogenedentota bacterium]|nr:MAG: 30S ribosomal protein S9 [Candidatus Hydrogenedentota bacterium]
MSETVETLEQESVKQEKRNRKPEDLFTGRRKTSVARVKVVKGSGKFIVNKRSLEEYFPRKAWQVIAKSPLVVTGKEAEFDVTVNVYGGGPTGQAGAIRLGVARALEAHDPNLHSTLRKNGMLTRDPRMVERKKYGLHKARRAPQFSKR